jgi:hypothetical protein
MKQCLSSFSTGGNLVVFIEVNDFIISQLTFGADVSGAVCYLMTLAKKAELPACQSITHCFIADAVYNIHDP